MLTAAWLCGEMDDDGEFNSSVALVSNCRTIAIFSK